jgi:hypothetical protein
MGHSSLSLPDVSEVKVSTQICVRKACITQSPQGPHMAGPSQNALCRAQGAGPAAWPGEDLTWGAGSMSSAWAPRGGPTCCLRRARSPHACLASSVIWKCRKWDYPGTDVHKGGEMESATVAPAFDYL